MDRGGARKPFLPELGPDLLDDSSVIFQDLPAMDHCCIRRGSEPIGNFMFEFC
jgi:hypothetical protein